MLFLQYLPDIPGSVFCGDPPGLPQNTIQKSEILHKNNEILTPSVKTRSAPLQWALLMRSCSQPCVCALACVHHCIQRHSAPQSKILCLRALYPRSRCNLCRIVSSDDAVVLPKELPVLVLQLPICINSK